MQPINPFLRAFFRSALPSQCLPINHHILLVPTTDVLVHSRDRETGAYLADLAGTEDFLASHVLRVAGGVPPGIKEGSTAREAKGKAKQYLTINARTVVIKDSFVYSNKGFKSLNQAQLLNDTIFYPDTSDNQQWIVYYISKPLIGSIEPVTIHPAMLTTREERERADKDKADAAGLAEGSQTPVGNPHKKDVKTFTDLLNEFPLIARQMQSGLEKIFKDFTDRFDKPAPKKSSRPPSVRSQASSTSLEDSLATLRTSLSISSQSPTLRDAPFSLEPEEEVMREALEGCVTAAIDLFQGVDKQQLSMLGATTSLSGPAVERLIERYVAEQLHERALFPALCRIKREEDAELDSRIRRMLDIDIAQVGIAIEGGKPGKRSLALRLDEAVATFKKQGVAGGPHEMIETLLATAKIVATGTAEQAKSDNETEKQALAMTMNADTLVSMLLIVVIRSGVRYLNARLSYMKHFVFIDEVEIGETGYALSTLEAVLTYLARDSDPMRRASRRNSQLWTAVRHGDLSTLQNVLEPYGARTDEPSSIDEDHSAGRREPLNDSTGNALRLVRSVSSGETAPSILSRTSSHGADFAAVGGSLEHVFPFQKPPTPPPEAERPKRKRVVMAATVRSGSISSTFSSVAHSRRASSNSVASGASGGLSADTSLETLSQTQTLQGDSLLMMAIDAGQLSILQYLLTLEEYYSIDFVLEDCNTEGTTLLCAAIQTERKDITLLLLDHILDHVKTRQRLEKYLARQDSKGRCVAHYLFNQPELLDRIGEVLPWRLRDKNGQTPLFALCRSYDHAQYRSMVDKALALAASTQPDHEALHLDDHVDNKGNTLLHIVNHPAITTEMLKFADADVNAANDKRFTPFMVASKYGKMDLARVLFSDPRTEMQCRDIRGLTAIELAKDDEIRNKIDDMVLLAQPVGPDGRITTVVRSLFVEDATIRVILKSGNVNSDGSVTVTTSRRSLADFENLAKWLSVEQPASWLPTQFNMASPFMIPSRPARAVLRDIQIRLDNFLHNLLTHTTFAHHEMVWEFFLVPDIDPAMLAERSKHKAEVRAEKVRDEYEPLADTTEVEIFVGHAYDQVRKLSTSTRGLIRRVNRQRHTNTDMAELAHFAAAALHTVNFLPTAHKTAFDKYARTLAVPETSPLATFYYALHSIGSTTAALLVALNRPTHLVSAMQNARQTLDRTLGSLSRQSRWTPNIGFFDETRRAIADEAQVRAEETRRELETLGAELRYTQQTVAAELAGWQEAHVKEGRRMLRELARGMVVKERERLDGMKRAVRELRKI
ncbi:hypothetical protein K461DRAFT_261420 [Myriangium duriaei CBS 260.36]|uniref:VPS9 domain-containing protein n=1 Tax=Myriangium duriaei CBS 260.36 TaxID=1168546 RepID=A0A9P4IXJ5_9PEZI|nr:hypothetical protein K461DRAFT_261420 [Myriangium duriaei CBS 260.36]